MVLPFASPPNGGKAVCLKRWPRRADTAAFGMWIHVRNVESSTLKSPNSLCSSFSNRLFCGGQVTTFGAYSSHNILERFTTIAQIF